MDGVSLWRSIHGGGNEFSCTDNPTNYDVRRDLGFDSLYFVLDVMDLNRPPSEPFNTQVEIRHFCRPKSSCRDFVIRNFGEDYYNRVLESSVPFVVPFIFERFRVFIITMY